MANSVSFADKVQVYEADSSKQKIDEKEFGNKIIELRGLIIEHKELDNNLRRIKYLSQKDLTEDQKEELNRYIDEIKFRHSYIELERV